MFKILLLIILIGLIIIIFKKLSNYKNEQENELIKCDNCNTFTPKNEIIKKEDKLICKDCYANTK